MAVGRRDPDTDTDTRDTRLIHVRSERSLRVQRKKVRTPIGFRSRLNPSHAILLRYSKQRRRIPATLCSRALSAPHRANEEREKRRNAVFSARTAMCVAAARAEHKTHEGAATPVDAQTALNLVPLLAPRGGATRPSGVVGVFLRGGGVGARPARLVTHV